ncbi:MAG TPA: DUF4440 domain-containing protein [Patescibacteria group bacterium]|nr:DUF4440 domain-containing protein [Patescibacteria group bacterium]
MSGPLDRATVAEELGSREPVFHRPVDGTARADWEAMTAPDFWEVGASGSVYSRSAVLDILDRRFSDPEYEPMAGLSVEDFTVRLLQGTTWLATYRLRQGDRLTRRASIWRRVGDRWVLLYHQGTVIAPG